MKNIFLLFGLALMLSNCAKQPDSETSLLHLIPQKSAAILRVPDWGKFKMNLKSSVLSNKLSSTGFGKTLKSYSHLFSAFNPDNETYISFVALGENDYDIALFTEVSKNLVFKDSIFNSQLKKVDYEGTVINSYTINDVDVYYIVSEGILIASTSKLILENTILQGNSGRDPIDASLQKMVRTSDSRNTNLYIKGRYYKRLFKDILSQFKFTSREIPFDWVAIDLEIENNSTQLNGVITSNIDDGQTLGLLNNLKPSSVKIAAITPVSSRGFSSLSIVEWDIYKANLAQKRSILLKDFSPSLEKFFKTINEIAILYTKDNSLIATTSTDNLDSENALAPFSTKKSDYRTIPIYELSDSLAFKKSFLEILNPPVIHYYCKLDSYFAFAEKSSDLEDLIANYQSGAVLRNSTSYAEFKKQLSDKSTLFYYGNVAAEKTYLQEVISKTEAQNLSEIDFEEFPHAGLQLIQEDSFTYINASLQKIKSNNKEMQVSQIASVKLDADLLNNPQLLDNYRTKGKNILVQDVSNTLYNIDSQGKIEWKKELDSPVLGDIQLIDLYKNGRLQYAFTTTSHFYVIASDGDIVKPFGFKMDEDITLPLAVFDYDGNRNYRFIITQGDNLTMYDSSAAVVKGFEFSKANVTVKQTPQHLRLGSKDYILIELENGALKILDRRGNTRINVKDNFKFAEFPIVTKDNNFIFYENDGTRISINQNGKVFRTKNQLDKNFQYSKLDKVEAFSSEHKITINENERELDLGIYKGLQVIRSGKKYYITLTDLQSNKVYLFNENGEILPNFPIYGSSKADAGSLNSNSKLGLVTKGESNSVIIYQIN